jgi:hypothetical protein
MGLLWQDFERPPDQRNRLLAPAALVEQDAEQVQGIGMAGIDFQDPPVEGLGPSELPGLMELERLHQRFDHGSTLSL